MFDRHSLALQHRIMVRGTDARVADTVKMRDITVGSGEHEEELKEYEECMKWFDECSKGVSGFNSWYNQKEDASKDERKVSVVDFCQHFFAQSLLILSATSSSLLLSSNARGSIHNENVCTQFMKL